MCKAERFAGVLYCGIRICSYLLVFGILFGTDIAILVISQQKHHYSCHNKGKPLEIKTFNAVAGSVGIVLNMITLCIEYYYINRQKTRLTYMYYFVMALFILIWAIIGSVVYSNTPNNCKVSSMGQITLAWCIITFIPYFLILMVICIAVYCIFRDGH